MLEQDPRVSEGPNFFQSLYGWMKRVAVEVNNAFKSLDGKVNRSGDTMTGGLNLVSPSTSATEASTDNSTRIATTAWAKVGFAISLGGAGYIKFPTWLGGLIIQWATSSVTTNAGGDQSISFPIAFPTGRTQVLVSNGSDAINSGNIALSTLLSGGWDTSLTGFAFHAQKTDTSTPYASGGIRVNWIAIGW